MPGRDDHARAERQVGERGADVRHRDDRARARVVVAEVVLDQPRRAEAEVAVEGAPSRSPAYSSASGTPGASAGTARKPKSTVTHGPDIRPYALSGSRTGAARSTLRRHGSSGQARLPARRGVDRQDDARRRTGRRLRHARGPRIRAPLHRDRPRPRGAVDERGVRPHRAHPLLEQLLRPDSHACCSATPTRSRPRASTRSTWALPPAGSRTSSRAPTTCSSSAASTCRGAATDPRVRVAAAPDARRLRGAGARQRPPLAAGRGRPRGTAAAARSAVDDLLAAT